MATTWFVLSVVAWGCLGAPRGSELPGKPTWTYCGTQQGNLPIPNKGDQQTACLVLDIDKDRVDDFVIAERTQAPSVVWYHYEGGRRWSKRVIENQPLPIEAGGDSWDIDGDGDLDVMFAGDYRSDGVWWWENPHPNHLPAVPWKRRTIKSGDGARHQHDSRFGDFDGDGRGELAWWSQTAKRLFLARIPPNPRQADSWPYVAIFSYSERLGHEGLDVADINLDGKVDLVGAGYWFEHHGGTRFTAHRIANRPFTRTAVGQLIEGDRPEIVISPGDADGPLELYRWNNHAWVGQPVHPKIVHGHSLAVADIDRDGHMDIFVGEMGSPGAGPDCKTRIFWGDGQGHFVEQVLAVGKALHESRLGDLDGNGKLDIVAKPYHYQAPILHLWLQD